MSCRRPVSYGFPVREVMSNVSSEVVHVFDLVWLCVWKRERLHTYKDLAGTLGMAHVQRVIPDMSVSTAQSTAQHRNVCACKRGGRAGGVPVIAGGMRGLHRRQVPVTYAHMSAHCARVHQGAVFRWVLTRPACRALLLMYRLGCQLSVETVPKTRLLMYRLACQLSDETVPKTGVTFLGLTKLFTIKPVLTSIRVIRPRMFRFREINMHC